MPAVDDVASSFTYEYVDEPFTSPTFWLAEGWAVMTDKEPGSNCPLVDMRIATRTRDGKLQLLLFQAKGGNTAIGRDMKADHKAVIDCINRCVLQIGSMLVLATSPSF